MKWKTKDGRELEISEMGTMHVVHTLEMLLREEARFNEAAADNSLRGVVLREVWSHRGKWIPVFQTELQRRVAEGEP